MHKDRAYKAGDKDVNALWQFDTETFCSFEDNQSKNRDQCHLNEEDLESSLESSMHVAWVQLHFLHWFIVECIEGHRISVFINVKLFILFLNLTEQPSSLFLDLDVFSELIHDLFFFYIQICVGLIVVAEELICVLIVTKKAVST